MGDSQKGVLRVDFDRRVSLAFLDGKVTTDAGLLAHRETDEVLGPTEMADDSLCDSHGGGNKQHQLVALLRQSIYSRLAGYEDVNEAERLAVDLAMRDVVGGRASQPEKQAASMSEVGRFETEMLSTKANIKKLMDLSGAWIDTVHQRKPPKKLILDMDSSVSETYGQQVGTAYDGHFECMCYHPLFLFNQDGDLERAMLRRTTTSEPYPNQNSTKDSGDEAVFWTRHEFTTERRRAPRRRLREPKRAGKGLTAEE